MAIGNSGTGKTHVALGLGLAAQGQESRRKSGTLPARRKVVKAVAIGEEPQRWLPGHGLGRHHGGSRK